MADLTFAVRYMGRNAGTTLVAVLSLALGMMATTAIYSVVHAVVLDPFPYADIDRLTSVRVVSVGQPGGRTGYSVDQFLEIAERSTIFEGVVASTISDVLWMNGAEPQRLRGNHGTGNTFAVMGVAPLLGRAFTDADARPDAAPVVVLGYRFWQRQFGGDPGVIGAILRLNDVHRTVIGVMPERFMWRGADIYIPTAFRRGAIVEGVRFVHLLGRLKPNVSEAQAEADLRPIISDLRDREPSQFPKEWRVGLLSFKETFPSSIRQNLWTLFGAVGLLLLIACANVSNLLLANAAARRNEMAVRAAIGASRWRVVRQLLVESLLLAGVAAVLGTVFAAGALRAILAVVPANTIPDEANVALSAPVLLFTAIVSIATSLVFGLLPALQTTSTDLVNPLRETSRSVSGSRAQVLLRKGLVVTEVALSVMLLVAAGLMIRQFLSLGRFDIGFATDRVVTMRVPLPERRYATPEARVAFFTDLLPRLALVPGVSGVGLNTNTHPFGNLSAPVEVIGSEHPPAQPAATIHQTSAGYPRALGIRVVAGRFFDDGDTERRLPVAVVNQTFVRTHVVDRDAVGRTVRIPRLTQAPFQASTDQFQIVGVVTDTTNRGVNSSDEVAPEVYVPFSLTAWADRLVIAAAGDPAPVMKAAVGQVLAVDPEQPVVDVRTIENLLQDGAYAVPRFNLVLFSVFAALGLALSVIGVYGVMSSAVAQQKHEVGVRMAIGASPADVRRMVLGRGVGLLAIGIPVGLAGALLSRQVLAGFLWNVSAVDPLTIGVVSVLMLVAGLQACFWPARRASRISPLVALRD